MASIFHVIGTCYVPFLRWRGRPRDRAGPASSGLASAACRIKSLIDGGDRRGDESLALFRRAIISLCTLSLTSDSNRLLLLGSLGFGCRIRAPTKTEDTKPVQLVFPSGQ